jgi:hypothetical protein
MDPTLSCSIGVVDPTVAADLVYCCLTGQDFKAGTCGQDDSISSICTTPGSYGFKCAAMDTPDQTDPALVCSKGVADADGSSTDFCCTAGGGTSTIVITSTCSADASVTGCAAPSAGYSCTATDPPDSMDPTLICSVGVASGGDTTYCCLSGETFAAGTCAQDLSVASCVGGSYGFSCAGTDTPDQTDPSLTCSIGVVSGSDTLFCCLSSQYSWTAGTCGPDDTIGTCQPGSFGFKCAASDTPDQTDPTLVCSTGVPDADGISTDFCCTD